MLSRVLLIRIAMRYDTAMSRAMLRACGCERREPVPEEGTTVSVDRYRGMLECFSNRESAMDGRTL